MAPSSVYSYVPGSVEEVVAHLALWGETVTDGFARVAFSSEVARQHAVAELERLFAARAIPFHTITLPRGASTSQLVAFLLNALRALPPGVASLHWSADLFPTDAALLEALGALNFRRESLAQFPLRQIWWMPHEFARRAARTIPDLNSWFFVRLELTEGAQGAPTKRDMPLAEPDEMKRGVFMVPMQRNPYFVGREETLQALHAALHDRKNVLLTQAISGLGGIGKTQTACEYAYRYRDEYSAVLWTSAENESALSAGYRQIARGLNLPEKHEMDAASIRAALRRWLQEHDNYLLILDNADAPETVRPLLPERPAGHILLTSRARRFSQLGNVSVLRLEPLPDEEAWTYLLRRVYPQGHTDEERDGARQLAAELDGLPLALELAASYLVQQKLDITTYLRKFRERRTDLLRASGPLAGDYRESVLATWEPNFRAVEQRNPAAAELLNLSAFLAPDAIPFEIFLNGAEQLGSALATALQPTDEQSLNIVELLLLPASYSLISVDLDARAFAIHRLVQVALRTRLDEAAQRCCVEHLIAALVALWPGYDFVHWQLLDRLLPHQMMCIEYLKDLKIETPEAAALYNQTGLYLKQRAEYSKVESLYQQALAIRQKSLPVGHLDIAASLNNLGALYNSQGRLEEAEPLYKQALAIDQQSLPAGHPDLAISLNNLAELYSSQGRLEEAAPLYQQALAIHQKSLPVGHPNIATSLNNLAGLYYNQGRLEEAEHLYQQALAIRQKYLPQDHPNIAQSLNNLAELYRSQERFEEAAPLYEQALAIYQQSLPAGHPNIATSLNNLAVLYYSQGRVEEAEPLLNQALTILENALGKEHPTTQSVFQNRERLRQAHKSDGRQ